MNNQIKYLYQAPSSNEFGQADVDKEQRVPASLNRRFLNLLIDTSICFGLQPLFFGLLLGLYFRLFGNIDQAYRLTAFLQTHMESNVLLSWVYLILLCPVLYYLVLEGLTGRTIGKLITRTKVVDGNGMKPVFSKILIRTAVRFIPLEWFSHFNEDCQGWHDKFSKTMVIKS